MSVTSSFGKKKRTDVRRKEGELTWAPQGPAHLLSLSSHNNILKMLKKRESAEPSVLKTDEALKASRLSRRKCVHRRPKVNQPFRGWSRR